ncbi:MAG: DUF2497 domain-containing protein [Rhodospirillaceae bacterium]|nr:DUF2497 domain-containing protein [Rhodospirillaceae bacterium]
MTDKKDEKPEISMSEILASIRQMVAKEVVSQKQNADNLRGANIKESPPSSVGQPLKEPDNHSQSPKDLDDDDELLMLSERDIIFKEPAETFNQSPHIPATQASQNTRSSPDLLLDQSTIKQAMGTIDRLQKIKTEGKNPSMTINDLAQEALKPLLREWLNKNLTPIVEKLVEREIQILTKEHKQK